MNHPAPGRDVVVYGKPTCPDTLATRKLLEDNAVDYVWHDVEADPAEQLEAMRLNGGQNRVPTVAIDADVVLVEPSDRQLLAALRMREPSPAGD